MGRTEKCSRIRVRAFGPDMPCRTSCNTSPVVRTNPPAFSAWVSVRVSGLTDGESRLNARDQTLVSTNKLNRVSALSYNRTRYPNRAYRTAQPNAAVLGAQ